MKVRFALLAAFAVVMAGCTARSAYVQPPKVQNRYLITMGDTSRPYESLGYLQMTRKGADLFGFISIVDADIHKLFGDVLIGELEKRHADGIINMRFHERQWTTAERIMFALPPLFLFPLPTRVELSGELIRWTDNGPPMASPPVTMK
ncbi:MAG TPA: hypothetical protein VL326_23395 [Kofleriaceae bacterium]|jgi:hypothetical protein|nr:hypothetical protein [Kofleriaceae bacterium]